MHIQAPRYLAIALAVLATLPASAATFVVTTHADSGPGSLRQAILDANANPGRDEIQIQHPVSTEGSLPYITDPVDIVGVGFPYPVVKNVLFADATRAFSFSAGSDGSTLRYVDIRSYMWSVLINLTSNVTVENTWQQGQASVYGNGHLFKGNQTMHLVVGATETEVIGNTAGLITLIGGSSNQIRQNTVSTNISVADSPGTAIVGNTAKSIWVGQNVPGAGHSIQANTVSGSEAGIAVHAAATVIGNIVHGHTAGIYVSSGAPPGTVIIGGDGDAGNKIYNNGKGIVVVDAIGVTITGNRIFDNSGPAIDLDNDGLTPNDPSPDADTGSNNRQNHPVLSSVTLEAGVLTVDGSLVSASLTPYTIQLFSSNPGKREARALLDSFEITTDVEGTVSFTRAVTAVLPSHGEEISATATNRSSSPSVGNAPGDTSEISESITFSSAGSLRLSLASYVASEDAGALTVSVERVGGTSGAIFALISTQDGSAKAGTHYTSVNQVLSFDDGQTLASVEVPLIDDLVYSGTTALTIALSQPAGTQFASPASATIQILDDDPTPTANLGPDLELSEGNVNPLSISFSVELSGASRVPASVTWNCPQLSVSGALTFQPGDTTKIATFDYHGADTLPGPDRVYDVNLTCQSGCQSGRAHMTITIIDDDIEEPLLSGDPATVHERRGEITVADFVLKLSWPVEHAITVAYETRNGTAIAGHDYTAVNGHMMIPPGETEGRIQVDVLDDDLEEPDETFVLHLTNVSGARLAASEIVCTIVDNDSQLPVLLIRPVDVNEGRDSFAAFRLTLSRPSPTPVRVSFSTSDETAIAGQDYVATSGTVVLAPYETETSILVPILDDAIVEPRESFTLTLTAAVGATRGNTSAICTIHDDDLAKRRSVGR